MSLDGVLYPMVVEGARLKPGLISTHKGPARNMSELKNAAKLAYAIQSTVAMPKNLDGFNCMLLPHCSIIRFKCMFLHLVCIISLILKRCLIGKF